jgi:hypothetical protein
MSLEDALEFVRTTDVIEWNQLIDEMNATRRRRDVEAAKNLSVGDLVVFDHPDPSKFLKGRVIRIGRTGRVILCVPSEDDGSLRRINVPAVYVKRVA